MPEVLPDHAPMPRAFLAWDGTRYRVCSVDAAGQLQVDVIASGLPLGAATAVNQALVLAQLQLIEELRDALRSVGTDRLLVRAQDQFFSMKGIIATRSIGIVSAADGYIDSPSASLGDYWVITTISSFNHTSPTTKHVYMNLNLPQFPVFHSEARAFALGDPSLWDGFTVLAPGNAIRAYFTGALVGDTVSCEITGYAMTVEL